LQLRFVEEVRNLSPVLDELESVVIQRELVRN